jgi:hypothetical protein
VRLPNYEITHAEAKTNRKADATAAVGWELKIGETWTLPAVELTRGEPKGTTILIADEGRSSVAAQAEPLLKDGQRVLAVDPFYFGESKIPARDFLYALLVSAVGERPLGVQAAQLSAVARWAGKQFGNQPVRVQAVGPRTSLIALVAAGLEPQAITDIELHDSLGSLQELIEQNRPVTHAPELFCFGLLERFDVPQLTALAAPRPVRFLNPSQRVQQELDDLPRVYALFGNEFDPRK